MKIAVPVHDEKLEIFVRVGRAPWFAIFDDEDFVELRPNMHTHEHEEEHHGKHKHGNQSMGQRHGNGHGRGKGFGAEELGHGEEPMETYSPEEVELHRKDLENIADVDVLLARAVGPNMKGALELSGIDVIKIRKKDGITATEVVQNTMDSFAKTNQ